MLDKVNLNLFIDLSEAVCKDLKSAIPVSLHLDKTKPSDFKILKKLAKGGYGEVYVVEKDKMIYAMKKVPKQLVLKNSSTTFFKNEKEIMTTHSLDWLVKSYMCLQDDTFLYYIMEFVHGGDLMGYLSKKDIMKEDEIRFYGAEIASAIHAMHEAGWIHRDLKPDNILLDREGHIKLADFGSCIKLENGKVTSNTTVGTPDYISPDVLSSTGENVTYGPEVDFWTIGVILYEMFFGAPPFYSNSLKETYSKINNIDFTFENNISQDLKDLISKLLCKKENRLNFEQLKAHPFFKGINWENLRKSEPPFKPRVTSNEDISNFVDTEFNPDNSAIKAGFIPFVGFTHDPIHVSQILSSIIDGYSNEINSVEKLDLSKVSLISNEKIASDNKGEIIELDETIETKKHELVSLKSDLNELQKCKDELSSQVSSLNSSLQQSIEQISYRKDHLDQIHSEINESKEQLRLIKADISEKMKLLGEISKKNSTMPHEIEEDLKDLKKMIERCKFKDKLDEIQQSAYWFYKQHANLQNEIKIISSGEIENKSLEDLKKQLRIQKSEIREYEQKIETEIQLRQKIEEEVKSLKKQLKEASKSLNSFVLTVTNANNNKEQQLQADSGALFVDGEEHLLSSIYIRDLKNNEMHHLSSKKRNLCVLLFFLKETVKTSSSTTGTHRSLKALESDLEKEQLIYKSICQLIEVLEGNTKQDAINQRNGTFKRIEQLKGEIENHKRSTIMECHIQDDEKVYEFNSHSFYEKTVAKGSLCEHCNEVLYGLVNQAYCCKECLLVVHKSCYVLVDVSCELNKAIKGSRLVPVICRSLEDKEKLLKLNKVS